MAYGMYLKQDYGLKSPEMSVFHVKKIAKKNCKIQNVLCNTKSFARMEYVRVFKFRITNFCCRTES